MQPRCAALVHIPAMGLACVSQLQLTECTTVQLALTATFHDCRECSIPSGPALHAAGLNQRDLLQGINQLATARFMHVIAPHPETGGPLGSQCSLIHQPGRCACMGRLYLLHTWLPANAHTHTHTHCAMPTEPHLFFAGKKCRGWKWRLPMKLMA